MPRPTKPVSASKKALATDETPRTITLGERVIPYLLRRDKRRTIGLSIDYRGLRVGAPPRTSLTEVEALILRHADWVAQKLDEWHRRQRPEPLKIVDGARLPMLGEELEIRLALGNNRAVWNSQSAPVLTLCLRSTADAARLLERALREKVRQLFAERLQYYADLLGVSVPPLTLSSARTRWGSCSRKTGIRLNWRLVHFSPHIVDYVVAHELAHLREMNHSPRFWAVVGQIYPAYKTARAELKNLAGQAPQWL